MTSPNEEPVMNTAELHTIEHLAATFLRNHPVFGPKMIYWGPMGCRTGNYLLLNGDYESRDIVPLMIETFEFIRDFEGEVPGASARDCGNYLDMNLGMAKYLAKRYLEQVLYDIRPDSSGLSRVIFYTRKKQHGHQMAVLFFFNYIILVMLCLMAAQYHLIQLHLPVYRHLQPH